MGDWVERYHQSRQQKGQKGGPGSGHWGHAGRPGKRGGSVPGKGGGGPDAQFAKAAKVENIKSDKPLGGGVTDSRLFELQGDGRGVWKKDESANNALSEVMVDQLDDVLDLGVVPHTVLMENQDGVVGSCQRFIDDATMAVEFKDDTGNIDELVGMLQSNRERTEGMVLLDYITGNKDRHFGNVIFDKEGSLWAIDNGSAQDWGFRGGKYWAMDLEPSVAQTGVFKLSPTLLAKVRDLTWDQLHGIMSPSAEAGFDMGFSSAWRKVQHIQQTGELKW